MVSQGSQGSKRRGTLVQRACQRCRKKRAKCDGQRPCQRCHEIDVTCEYRASVRQSKEELRAEIRRLKGDKANFANSISQNEKKTSCFQQLLSWRSCVQNRRTQDIVIGTLSGTTRMILPPLPRDTYISEPQLDTWTQTGWTKSHIRHLFDVVFTWDYLPFCFLCKDLFIQDYENASPQFCSSPLVNATLALASRLMNDNDMDEKLPSGWLGSQFFFDAATRGLQAQSTKSLPNIQTLGILSLYEIRCGREEEAFEFAESLISDVTELCKIESRKGEETDEYTQARATTYCGAVSLVRMLQLATGNVFFETNPLLQKAILNPEHSLRNHHVGAVQEATGPTQDIPGLQCQETQTIAAKIFQLTELVYKVIAKSLPTTPNITSAEITEAYNKCLDWYNSIFGILKVRGGRTPFALFVHMYYHFCILCMFRPFIGQALENYHNQPHEICTQAAQCLLALAQAYDDLFTLKRVPGLMPYFVCTSGLFGLAMEESGSVIDPVQLRIDNDGSQLYELERTGHQPTEKAPKYPKNSSHVEISVVTHAHLLLARMCSSHSVAVVAERLLQEALLDRQSPSIC